MEWNALNILENGTIWYFGCRNYVAVVAPITVPTQLSLSAYLWDIQFKLMDCWCWKC